MEQNYTVWRKRHKDDPNDSSINMRYRIHIHIPIVKHTHNFSHVYNISKSNWISHTLSVFQSCQTFSIPMPSITKLPNSFRCHFVCLSLSLPSSCHSYIGTYFLSTHTYKVAQMMALVGGVGWCPGVPAFCNIAFHIFHFHSPELRWANSISVPSTSLPYTLCSSPPLYASEVCVLSVSDAIRWWCFLFWCVSILHVFEVWIELCLRVWVCGLVTKG